MTLEEKRREQAARRKIYQRAYYLKHRQREKEKERARYLANPEKYRDKQRARYYGISPEQAAALLASQGGRCAICATDTPAGRGMWHLDHDHKTGKIRNFLCQPCNSGLGFFRDNPERMETAAEYVRRHQKAV